MTDSAMLFGLPCSGNHYILQGLRALGHKDAGIAHPEETREAGSMPRVPHYGVVAAKEKHPELKVIVPYRHPLCQQLSMMRRFPKRVKLNGNSSLTEHIRRANHILQDTLNNLDLEALWVPYEDFGHDLFVTWGKILAFCEHIPGTMPLPEWKDGNTKYLENIPKSMGELQSLCSREGITL